LGRIGEVLSAVHEVKHADKSLALTQNESEFTLGRVLVSEAEWKLGVPLQIPESLKYDLNIVASIPPFNAKSDRSIILTGTDGTPFELRDHLGNLILVFCHKQLNPTLVEV
jgi:hypothetical protein